MGRTADEPNAASRQPPAAQLLLALVAIAGADGVATVRAPAAAPEDGVDAGPRPSRGSCALRCASERDCCADGQPDCPGRFPRNWHCVGGFCELGGCGSDDDCRSDATPGLECHPAGGRGICFDPCESDADCAATPGASCRGPVDDGARLCGAFEFGCGDDTECFDWGVCDIPSGLCGCTTDSDCSVPGAGCRR